MYIYICICMYIYICRSMYSQGSALVLLTGLDVKEGG